MVRRPHAHLVPCGWDTGQSRGNYYEAGWLSPDAEKPSVHTPEMGFIP